MLKSKKFIATVLGVVGVILTNYLGLSEEMSMTVAGLVGAYVFGQGIADHGKEKEKITDAFSRALHYSKLPSEKEVGS